MSAISTSKENRNTKPPVALKKLTRPPNKPPSEDAAGLPLDFETPDPCDPDAVPAPFEPARVVVAPPVVVPAPVVPPVFAAPLPDAPEPDPRPAPDAFELGLGDVQ